MRIGPDTRADYKTFQVVPTRWNDNDSFGHLNNAVHYSLFDSAIAGWLMENTSLDVANDEQICVVVENGCNYFEEISFPDVVTVGLRITHIGTSSVRYEIGLFRNDDLVTAARGHFVHVYVNEKSRAPEPMSDTVRALFTSILKSED
ncbi:acyl-CoA thioester hydrolase [Cohaesibacter marisflavi]|uniref:Acyl-CoA thioester hydrolase n=1 Tax=Cohaesibacter marisflavi TaxID=655353 RepID=A0A1I4ZPR7_9HYPH|nr:thioesterase family protein [Cohaesibacter marisflavi]SFN51979.1 acyl-CoA thioester hydrolase [Cohaesibacter marisflavi]